MYRIATILLLAVTLLSTGVLRPADSFAVGAGSFAMQMETEEAQGLHGKTAHSHSHTMAVTTDDAVDIAEVDVAANGTHHKGHNDCNKCDCLHCLTLAPEKRGAEKLSEGVTPYTASEYLSIACGKEDTEKEPPKA